MNSKDSIIKTAQKTIKAEGDAILSLSNLINEDFSNTVALILKSKGRVIITGVGKSAIIAQKIVASLNSTGTPSIFMHAADAIHGDLGLVLKEDIVICISKSGNTPEIKVLVPLIQRAKNKIVAITGNTDSFLAQHAHYVLNTFVEKEVCPNNLAPTTSTTAQLVMGDALVVCLLQMRQFSSSDFAKYHPGGALGKKLYLKVLDLSSINLKPEVPHLASVKEVIIEMTEKMLGVTAVTKNHKIIGIITDGDLRRMLAKTSNFEGLTAQDIMSPNPKKISIDKMAIDAKEVMETYGISQLLVENNGKYAGVIHIHDLVKEGII